jgi:hypothetical protein
MAGALEKLRTPAWSLYADPAGGPWWLYDLRHDPGETVDVSELHLKVPKSMIPGGAPSPNCRGEGAGAGP